MTGQSDLYSLGIVLFEMLTGDVPFHGENQVAVAMKHVREQLPDVQVRRPEVSAALAAVVDRATAKDLDRRYATDDELDRRPRGRARASRPRAPASRPARRRPSCARCRPTRSAACRCGCAAPLVGRCSRCCSRSLAVAAVVSSPTDTPSAGTGTPGGAQGRARA